MYVPNRIPKHKIFSKQNMEEIRKEIDRIDDMLCALFEKRMHLAQEMAVLKKEKHLPVLDEKREAAVLEKGIHCVSDPELKDNCRVFLQCLMTQSKAVQEKWLSENG